MMGNPGTTTDLKEQQMTGFAAFTADELAGSANARPGPYLEFLRRPGFSMGLYQLPVGGTDHQHPHDADEVYVVHSGRATLRVDGVDHPVGPGSIVSVDRHVEHGFRDIIEDLAVLVVFAPPETPDEE